MFLYLAAFLSVVALFLFGSASSLALYVAAALVGYTIRAFIAHIGG